MVGTVAVLVLTYLLMRAYRPWFVSDHAAPLDKCPPRKRRRREWDGAETYIGMHWTPKCAWSKEPVMVLDDDDDDVGPEPDPADPSSAVVVAAAA